MLFPRPHLSAAAAPHSAHRFIPPGQMVVAAVCGGGFLHSSSSSIASTVSPKAARLAALRMSRRTAQAAHSEFDICVFMVQIFCPPQPFTQPVNEPIFSMGGAMYQSEISIPRLVTNPSWVDQKTVNAWATWRDAVLWCWEHRPARGMNENGDQATFRLLCVRAYKVPVHAPHVSRWVNPKTKAPMDLPPDLVSAFEEFTGWHGLTQFFNRKAKTTCLEEMQARLAA